MGEYEFEPGGEAALIVGAEDAGKRLDVFISEALGDISRSQVSRLIEQSRVRDKSGQAVKKSGYKVSAGEEFWIELPEPAVCEAVAEDIPLDILYEDSDVIVVNKPKGMVVHPDSAHRRGTLVNGLLFHCRDLSGIGGVMRPGIVHRIDMNTTGSVIACKNDTAHADIAAQLKEHSINRVYVAIALGRFKEGEGVIDAPIGRSLRDRKRMAVVRDASRGKRAVTHYRVISENGDFSYVECRLETGRTHQIRVHMAHIAHPLLGDEVYGRDSVNRRFLGVEGFCGQCLHAMTLGFKHPGTGEYVETRAPLPGYFKELLRELGLDGGSDGVF